jgi:ferric-dicitrate binding protein FerR (iron transport regulator)
VNSGRQQRDERARHLMMAALDDELSAAERREWEALLSADADLRAEWERLSRVKEVTNTMAYRKPPEEIWQHYWESVYNQAERGVGWILVSLGAVVLASFGIWQFVTRLFADSTLPPYLKYALISLLVGGAILLFSVIREKWFTYRSDPYREVQR